MPLYNYRCKLKVCGRRPDLFLSIAAMKRAKSMGNNGLSCPYCESPGLEGPIISDMLGAPQIKKVTGGAMSGTFDFGNHRDPPELDGVSYSSEREYAELRAAAGIVSKGEVNPVDRADDGKVGPNRDQQAAPLMVQIERLLRERVALGFDQLVAEFPDRKATSLKSSLTRLAKKGRVERYIDHASQVAYRLPA